MGTVSDLLHLKVNLKNKIYLYVTSTTQRWPNKIFKTYLIEDFFLFVTGVNDTGGAPWAWNDPNGILRGLGETDPWKKPEVENLVALSLESIGKWSIFVISLAWPASTHCPSSPPSTTGASSLLSFLFSFLSHRWRSQVEDSFHIHRWRSQLKYSFSLQMAFKGKRHRLPTPAPPSTRGKAGRNHLNEEIPPPPHWDRRAIQQNHIKFRTCCADVNSLLKRKCWTNSGRGGGGGL